MNNEKTSTNKTEAQVKRFRWRLIMAFISIMVAVIILLAAIIAQRSGDTMVKRTATLINSNTSQQVMNVDNYLEKIKVVTSLFFSEDIYYQYDATSDKYDDFDKIQFEKQIQDRIQDLGVLENYADFGVIYANDHTVGWISDATYTIFKDGNIYSGIQERIRTNKNEAAWFSDDADNHKNIFYAKRLNENAILFVSFYSNEMANVFDVPDDMQEYMVVRLVDEDSNVLYSSNKDEIGKELADYIDNAINAKNNSIVLNSEYFITTNKCESNDWHVVCSIPYNIFMKEINEIKLFTYIISFAMLLLVIALGMVLVNKVSTPMNQIVLSLADKAEHDLLTGVLNKISFENAVKTVMDTCDAEDIHTFVMLDMDNFKTVNDTLGHNVGDRVLMRLSTLLKGQFGNKAIIGRLGGDEFALFINYNNADTKNVKKKIQSEIELLRNGFAEEFKKEADDCNLSMSAGIVLSEYNEMDFEQMYKAADIALYESKKNGKNRFTFFKEG